MVHGAVGAETFVVVVVVVVPVVLASVLLCVFILLGCLPKVPKLLWLYKYLFVLLLSLLNLSFSLDLVLFCLNSLVLLTSKLHCEMSLSCIKFFSLA